MSAWAKRRKNPYTVSGIARLRCIRCGDQAVHQWQICADGNNWRPLCRLCDAELNRLVLDWMGHPTPLATALEYEERMKRARGAATGRPGE